jgi:hypothetical protein
LPPYDGTVDVDPLLAALGFLQIDAAKTVQTSARLRATAELDAYAGQILAYHWRMVDFRLRPEATRFDQVNIFGPFDLTWASLCDGDLCLQGTPIAEAEHGVVSMCASIAVERHRAANWLHGSDPVYSETPTDT